MRARLFIVILILQAAIWTVNAQSISSIQSNPQNIVGIGADDTKALSSMTTAIGKAYASSLDSRIVLSYQDEFRSSSRKITEGGQTCRYISRSAVEEIFQTREKQAETIHTNAMESEKGGDLGRAAMYHYWCIALYSSLPGDHSTRVKDARNRYMALAEYKFPSTSASNIGSKVEVIYKAIGKPTVSASHIRVENNSTEAKHTVSHIVQDTSDTIQERRVIPAGITLSIDSEKARKTEATVIEAERFPNAAIISERESHQIGTNKIHRWTGFISAGAIIWQNPGIRVMGGPLYRKHLGAYVAGTWNCRTAPYSYEFGKDGVLEGGGNFWGDGNKRVSDWSLAAGAIWMPSLNSAGFYAGAGYARKSVTFRDIDGNYAQDRSQSFKGMTGEAGLIGSYNHFTMTTGVTVSRNYLQISAGVGYIF